MIDLLGATFKLIPEINVVSLSKLHQNWVIMIVNLFRIPCEVIWKVIN